MKRHPLRRKLDRLVARYFVYFSLFIINTLPEKILYYYAKFIARCAFIFYRKYRRLALNNLKRAFNNRKSEAEINKIVKELFHQIAWGATEITLVCKLNSRANKRIKENITIEGEEFLSKAVSKGKGVICVSAHFGNFSLISHRLQLAGFSTNMVVRDANDPVVAKIWDNILENIGINFIPARPTYKAVSNSLKWLREGNVLILFADQNKTTGIYVDFFNRPAGTVEGPALLSMRTGAPILCAFIIRLSKDKHKIVITPPLEIEQTGDETKDIYNITSAYTKVIEDFVRQYPDHWWWVHDRWKGMKKLKNVSNDELLISN